MSPLWSVWMLLMQMVFHPYPRLSFTAAIFTVSSLAVPCSTAILAFSQMLPPTLSLSGTLAVYCFLPVRAYIRQPSPLERAAASRR